MNTYTVIITEVDNSSQEDELIVHATSAQLAHKQVLNDIDMYSTEIKFIYKDNKLVYENGIGFSE